MYSGGMDQKPGALVRQQPGLSLQAAGIAALVQPCHRVIASGGGLGGYAGGLERKSWLLAHEGAGLLVHPA